MFQVMSLPSYLRRGRRATPGEPFANLLDDEAALADYKRNHPHQALKEARKLARYATQQVKILIAALTSKDQPPTQEEFQILREHLGSALELEAAAREAGLLKQLERLAYQILAVITKVETEGVPDLEKAVVLSSSWLLGAISRFSTSTESHLDYVTQMDNLILAVSQFLNHPQLTLKIRQVARILRNALLYIPDEGAPSPSTTGTLYLSILKRQRPNRIRGPYVYPEVKWSTWQKMNQAKGQNGTGAGTVFWREYLRGYRNQQGVN